MVVKKICIPKNVLWILEIYRINTAISRRFDFITHECTKQSKFMKRTYLYQTKHIFFN